VGWGATVTSLDDNPVTWLVTVEYRIHGLKRKNSGIPGKIRKKDSTSLRLEAYQRASKYPLGSNAMCASNVEKNQGGL